MADENKKYVEVFNNGAEDLYICDKEAREAIEQLDPAQYASVQTCQDIIDELT